MKKPIYALILPLVVASGLVFADQEKKVDTTKVPDPTPVSAAGEEDAMKQWAATPEGLLFTLWESSPIGKKVYASEAKIRGAVQDETDLEAVVTSLSLPPGSRLGFGVMARINGDEFIVNFDPEESQLAALQSLKVDDKLIIRSRFVSHAPKYAYPILRGDYVEREGKIVYKRTPRKGC